MRRTTLSSNERIINLEIAIIKLEKEKKVSDIQFRELLEEHIRTASSNAKAHIKCKALASNLTALEERLDKTLSAPKEVEEIIRKKLEKDIAKHKDEFNKKNPVVLPKPTTKKKKK